LERIAIYIRTGLFGFNGALVRYCVASFAWVRRPYIGVYCIRRHLYINFYGSFSRLLDIWKAPTLTAPFVLSTILFTLAATNTEQLHLMAVAPPSITKMTESALTLSALIEGTLNGIAQVFLQENIITGIFFVIGLLISSRAACVAALLGSFMGLLVAWGVGDSESAIRGWHLWI
jgi:urea transporter